MKSFPRTIVILLVIPLSVSSQTITTKEAGAFIRDLLGNKPSVESWFDPASRTVAHRLGIVYDGVQCKNFIGYDVDDSVKALLQDGRLGYSVTIDSLENPFARIVLMVTGSNDAREYYFKGKNCISPLAYWTRTWKTIESSHFRFFLSDPTLFNAHCVDQLEAFLTYMASLLGLSMRDMQTLHEQKIYYCLCKDEEEIQRLTGYRARGMYNLAYDAMITTYNVHEHELLHLLINYKLRRLPLYTHPFLQEGFAVAYGGRGGLESRRILPIGRFLFPSQFVDLPSLLDNATFRQIDASISYPASGLYNRFLIETIGIQAYLDLYRKHSGRSGDSGLQRISTSELPAEAEWTQYLEPSAGASTVTFDTTAPAGAVIFEDSTAQIKDEGAWLSVRMSDVALLRGSKHYPDYTSRLFKDLYPQKIYHGEKYMIKATEDEISVYNLFTNNLIAGYVASFSIPSVKVPRKGNKFCFRIKGDVFDEKPR